MTGWRVVAGFVLYGIVLIFMGAMLSGMAEGSVAALAIFGSPASLLPVGAFGPVVIWTAVGILLAIKEPRWAGALVVLHYVCVPIAVYYSLRYPGLWREDWRRQQLTCNDGPWECLVLLLPYLAGQFVFWRSFGRLRS